MSFPAIRPEDVENLPEVAMKALRKALRVEMREAAARHQALVFARRRKARKRQEVTIPVDAPGVLAERRAALLEGDGDRRVYRDDVPEPQQARAVWRWSAA